ncbi:MAG: TetR/AcrR family transcriptional regulator [Bacteroidetes bacterium]|nr:TetR/AcrR family transcriptional regulator [Bacteroidota bacterium]
MRDSREHILTTSLHLFIENGFKGVTMQEIVKKTGLSKGAFYHYFKSKEQVFEEVINHFYTELMMPDYGSFSKNNLKRFYLDLLEEKKNRVGASKIINNQKNKIFTPHHYFLMFDAIKMFPDFKKLKEDLQKEELRIWVHIIEAAKKSKEIKTKISTKELAMLFIYTEKGINIRYIMAENYKKSRQEVKKAWDSLYATISTKNNK